MNTARFERKTVKTARERLHMGTARFFDIRSYLSARVVLLGLALIAGATLPHLAYAQKGSGNSGTLTGDGMSLEWHVDGADVGERFFAERTWQAKGTITSTAVRFSGVMRASVPKGFSTHSGMKAYISLPMSSNKKDKDWNGELSSETGLSHEMPFDFTLDVRPGTPILVSASVNRVGGEADLLGVTFQFAPPRHAVAEDPNQPYWAWVQEKSQWSPRTFVNAAGEAGSTWSGGDGALFIKKYWPGGGTNASPLTFSAVHKWRMPLWLKAGSLVPVEFSIDKVQYKQHDTEPGMRGYAMSTTLAARISPPGGDYNKQYETFANLSKGVFDGSPDLSAPTSVKTTATVTAPAYAKEWENKILNVAVIAGNAPEVWVVYKYNLHQVSGPPPEPPVAADPEDPASPCAGKSAEVRQALLKKGRSLFFDGTYLWLDYYTASDLRKLWWNADDAKSKYGLEAAKLGYDTAAKWVATGRGAAAAVLAVGLAGMAAEDRVKDELRALDRKFGGDRVVSGLGVAYDAYRANFDAIDKIADAEKQRTELENLGKAFVTWSYSYLQDDGARGKIDLASDLAGYSFYWSRRSGSDMSFGGAVMARLYELHLAEKELGCQ